MFLTLVLYQLLATAKGEVNIVKWIVVGAGAASIAVKANFKEHIAMDLTWQRIN